MQLVVAPRSASDDWRPSEHVSLERRCVVYVDTGAPITVLPYETWQPFAADVDLLAQPSDESELNIAGGRQRGQLGRIRLGATDDDLNWMPARWTFALLLDEVDPSDDGALRIPLLGLQSHFFRRNRRICHVGNARDENLATIPEYALEDRPRWRPW